MGNVRFVGLDVHAETVTVAVAESAGEVRALGTIPNRPEAVRRLIHKVGPVDELRVCYEAGPTGYVLYWQLIGLGVHCASFSASRRSVLTRSPAFVGTSDGATTSRGVTALAI